MDKQNLMQKELHRNLTNSAQAQHIDIEASQSTNDSVCSKCGARVSRDMKFCEECGNPLGVCPNCHKQVNPSLALCPHCGTPIHTDQCSFCNAFLDVDDRFCPECGNPRKGIVCPECNTVNYRSFCRKCNTPLNQMANEMVNRVLKDPRVIEARALAQKMFELEETIKLLAEEIDGGSFDNGPDSPLGGLTDADKELLNKYNELFRSVGNFSIPINSSQPNSASVDNVKAKKPMQIKRTNLKSAIEDYRANMSKMQEIFDSLIPEPNDPPEIQRNFLCACKVAIQTTHKKKEVKTTGWVCNYCGCLHSQPSECTRPELGGKWIVNEVEIITKITKTHTVYL